MTAPRVLAVTSEPPWPLTSGGHIRTFHLLKALARSTELRLLCPTPPVQAGRLDAIRAAGIDIRPIEVNGRRADREARRLARAFLRGEPYVMYRRHAWPSVAAAWRAELQRFEPQVLYFDHLDSFVYRSTRASGRQSVAIDLHNIYSLLVRRAADDQPSRLKRWFLRHQASLLESIEHQAARHCDAVLAVSDVEAAHFRQLGARHVVTIPNGVDCTALDALPVGRTGSPTIVFIGTMSWGPNAAAARFLAQEVLPEVRRHIANARLVILGRDPDRETVALGQLPGVEVTGTVPDVTPFLTDAAVLAVPLEAGGGTRLKILEAFAAGLPVVSTAIGVEGIDARPGVHFRLAERREFARALISLLNDRPAATTLASAARALARQSYDWSSIGERLAQVVTSLPRS